MRYGNTVYSLQEGYDPEHADDRIGFILRGEVLKQLISEGIRVYDFLAGNDEHKARWKPQAGSYHDLHWARSWSKGGVLLNCAHRSLATKEWLRARLQSSAWRFLHKVNLALRPRTVQASSKSSDD
jgi:CelD/BcsL family acetyltransferase involved in cellulose biosynthesis